MVKDKKGFTLVEVIVVAVIVAVLAAVAIPLYMGYIRDSRIDVGNNVGGTLASASGATKQQNLAVPQGPVVSPAPPADPLHVTFPAVNPDPAHPNQVLIPNSYTSDINNTHASCFFTSYGASSCQYYKFSEAP